jgi:hypothetical protein
MKRIELYEAKINGEVKFIGSINDCMRILEQDYNIENSYWIDTEKGFEKQTDKLIQVERI